MYDKVNERQLFGAAIDVIADLSWSSDDQVRSCLPLQSITRNIATDSEMFLTLILMESEQPQSAVQKSMSQAAMLSHFVTILIFGIVFSFGVYRTTDNGHQQKISFKPVLKTGKIEVVHVPFTAPFKSEPQLPPSNFPDENKIEEEGADEDTLELYTNSKRKTLLAYDCQSIRLRPLKTFDKRNSRALFVLHHSWKIFSA